MSQNNQSITWCRQVATITLFSLLATALTCNALPEDRDQPIKIDADRAIRDDKTGITQFIGNATLSQGTLTITGDDITINYNADGVNEITATGEPATLQQVPDATQGQVTAKAMTIEYSVASEIVNLKQKASIDQDGSVITSDLIRYDIRKSTAEASGENRVNIVIPANKASSDK